MPVPVKFSKEFYERFGHEATDELVNWISRTDETYRTELRALNELNSYFTLHVQMQKTPVQSRSLR